MDEETKLTEYDQVPLVSGMIREVTITLAEYRELVIAKTKLEVIMTNSKKKNKE